MRRLLLQPGLNVARRGASGGAEMRIGIVALLSVLSLSLARAYLFFHWHRHVGGSTNESPHLNM